MEYLIRCAKKTPELTGNWDGRAWKAADIIDIALFHPKSSDHRPVVKAKLLYDDTGLYVFFKVNDRYVRCEYSDYQDRVCRDSCVQFFVKPKADKPYFNLEMNCGGTLLFYQMEDPTMVNGYHKKYTEVEKSLADEMRIYHSMPQTVMPEIAAPVEWKVEYFVPFKLFEYYLGPLGKIAGQTWRANLHKCADKSSHPHWATWAPIGEVLSFHKPECFAPIRFEAK